MKRNGKAKFKIKKKWKIKIIKNLNSDVYWKELFNIYFN